MEKLKPASAVSELHSLTLAETVAAIRDRTVSPVDVTRAYLDRIARLDRSLHAYVEVYGRAALALARASEHRVRSGMPTGLLEGAPLAIKDLFDIAGFRTTAGTTMYAGRGPAQTTSTVVSRLVAAGAIPLGKTHMVELAYGGWGTNRGMGTPRNPWDMNIHRAPGGSSSGSAVAVAGGLAAAAIGTDTGGSVRIPAAFCGLTGLKTTVGRVSSFAVTPLSHTLDTVGPMGRSAEDVAMLLQAIHGPDPADPRTLHVAPEDLLTDLHGTVAGVRFSVVDAASLGKVDECVVHCVTDAAAVLSELGCLRNDDALTGFDFMADQEETGLIISAEAFAAYGASLDSCTVEGDAAARARILRGRDIQAARYASALLKRRVRQRDFLRVFESIDVLVLPSVPVSARALDAIDESDLAPSRLTRFVNYFGACAVALPCGRTPEGLPLSVQLVGAPYREKLLLRLGAAFQRVTNHHRQRAALL